MSAMDFQRHFVLYQAQKKEPFRRIVSYVSCIIISKSWLVWTHHLIVIINEKVNSKSPLSGATDSLLINLRSFPPSPLFVFSFIKRGTFWVHVFLFYFLLLSRPTKKSSAPDSSGSPSTFPGGSPKCRRREKENSCCTHLYQRFSKCRWRYKLVIEFSKEESTTSYFTSSAHRTRIFRSFVFLKWEKKR